MKIRYLCWVFVGLFVGFVQAQETEYHGLGVKFDGAYVGPSYAYNANRYIEIGVQALGYKLFSSDDWGVDETAVAQVNLGVTTKIPFGSFNFRPLGIYPGFSYLHVGGDGEIDFLLRAPFLNISIANQSTEFVLGPSLTLLRDANVSIYTLSLFSAELRLLF